MAQGDLYWYQHHGQSNGTSNWANGGNHKQVGSGWDFKHVFAAGEFIYGVTNSDDLYWYQHLGQGNGTSNWANGGNHKQVGSGWNFKQVFGNTGEVIYGVVN
ncbi:MAG TPA: tachylectin-related carbohydrate-binding protein [Xanthobacteraceae bacterium]|nr:tachylectin-related carbohydrate-binding protein [Xanthobacteraceae bacterium]